MEQQRELLRFTTTGSVDDGKSTLIGRLLLDSKALFKDQLSELEAVSKKRGMDFLDLSLITDGLRAEREQGITIDVAYRYFDTPKRKFIIADAPGHIQYTRNMVTAASNAQVALLLIDARKGVLEQTKRHALIASILQIQHLIICVNKMDLVDYSAEIFDSIKVSFQEFSRKLEIHDIIYIPVSALKGDNIVYRSKNMDWYEGSSLKYYLENVHISSDRNLIDCRFPVQHVIRPRTQQHHDYRAYAGKVSGGTFRKGDEVMILPSGFRSTIKSIDLMDDQIEEAIPPLSVNIRLDDELDISRGDMIVRPNNSPLVKQQIDLMICWFDAEKKLEEGNRYIVRHTTKETICLVEEIQYRIDINTLHRDMEKLEIKLNDIARIKILCSKALFVDSYRKNKVTGSVILIDEQSNMTVAAGMIL